MARGPSPTFAATSDNLPSLQQMMALSLSTFAHPCGQLSIMNFHSDYEHTLRLCAILDMDTVLASDAHQLLNFD